MDTVTPDIAARLGFDDGQTFDEVAVLDARASTADHGDIKTAALVLAAIVDSMVGQDPTFRSLPEVPALAPDVRCEVQQWAGAPWLYLVRTADPSVGVRAADEARLYRASPREFFVDARTAPQHLRIEFGGASQLWTLTPERVAVYVPRAGAEPSPSAQALARWTPRAVSVAVPAEAEVFDGLAPPAWMRSEVASRLRSGTPWEVASAWGMAARLAPSRRAASVRDLLAGPSPQSAAVAWLRRSPEACRDVAAQVTREADLLTEALDPLAEALAAETPGARSMALAWLHRRDDLASVSFVLARADADADVTAALAHVDGAAAARQVMWAFAEAFDDPWLSTVSWQEPEAWWARVALGR